MIKQKLEELRVQSQYRLLEKLRESEERYRSLYVHAPIGLWEQDWSQAKQALDKLNQASQSNIDTYLSNHPQTVWDIVALIKIVDINQMALDQLGAESRLQLPNLLNTYLTDASIQQFIDVLTHFSQGNTHFQCEIPLIRLDGVQRFHFVSLIVLPGHEQSFSSVMVTSSDITENRQAQENLKKNQQFLHMSQLAGGIGTWEADLKTGQQIWSDAVSVQLGFPNLSTPKLDDFLASIHPDDRQSVLAAINAHLHDNEKYCIEYRIIDQQNQIRWMCSTGNVERDNQNQPVIFRGVVQEITERKHAIEKLRLNERIFQTTQEGIMVTDAAGNLVSVNQAFCKITGYEAEEVLGKNPRLLKSGRHDPEFYQQMWHSIHSTGHWSGEIWNRRKNGEQYAELITISAIHDDSGTLTHYVGSLSDITLLKQHEKQLESIAHYDALTGIPNRVLLIDRMHQAQAQTRRENNSMAICYLDLDGFKPINDTLGHAAGDQVLIEIASRIGDALRGGDTVARLGGDEFVILLLGIHDTEQCKTSIQRLLSLIAEPIIIENQQFLVTASIGVTLYPNDQEAPDTLMRHADQAMYMAKQSGKNRFHIFDPDQEVQIKLHNQYLASIHYGLQANEFELHYQPKINLISGEMVGVEALVRWQHPERGLLHPDAFLPEIENSTLEILFGDWVIDQALLQLSSWQSMGLDIQVSVNISVNHLQSSQFVESLKSKLRNYPGINNQALQIEILETAALMDIPKVVAIIDECEQLGVSCALDDFGTGYSSLAYLRRLPADTLKIDVSFVRDMLEDNADREIVKGVIALANTFNRTTVAEGVESPQHFELLQEMGCHIGQGHGIAYPMPAKDIPEWYAAHLASINH